MLRPLLISASASRKRKRRQVVVISAPGGGKVVGLEGPPPPQRVAITEWDSLEKAEAFWKSKDWTDLGPERDKAFKTIRRYAVEAVQ